MGRSDTVRWTWPDVLARRLRRHRLVDAAREVPDGAGATSPSDAVGDVVRSTCGAHAQVMTAAEVSIGLRTSAIDRDDVQRALWVDRSVVKTYGPRGTVHLLPTTDLPMWCAALSAVPSSNPLPSEARLSPEQADDVVGAIDAALSAAADGLTVDELGQAVVGSLGEWSGDLVVPAFGGWWPRWRQAIATAAARGVLCFGPPRGRMVTFTSARRWLPDLDLPDLKLPEPDVALAGAVTAYLRAYGPATSQHLAQWLNAPTSWAARVMAAAEPGLSAVDVDGERCWVVEGDEQPDGDAPEGLRLLPYFDPYAVGSQPRDRIYPGAMSARALTRGQAGTFAVLLIDGVVDGVWHQQLSGRRLRVTVEPRTRLSAARRRRLEAEVERVGAIRGARPELTIGPVTTGGHA